MATSRPGRDKCRRRYKEKSREDAGATNEKRRRAAALQKGQNMKEKKIDAVEVWKELDAMAPRLGLTVIDRAVYLHLLRLTHVEGKRRLRFSILGIAPDLGLSGHPVREAVRRLMDKGALRLIERSNIGHLVEVRLPREVRAPRARRTDGGARLRPGTNLDEVDFLRTRDLRLSIHDREGGLCFYCMRRTPARAHCLDHVVPAVEGGRNSYRNLVSCCMDCNGQKRAQAAPDFLRRLYRAGRLSQEDLSGRLRALEALAAGKLRPQVLSEEDAKSERGEKRCSSAQILPPLRNVLKA
jgi:5-methylcytosine-specific restriction endonuclease McrA